MQTNRRELLKATSAAAVLGATGLAGCMGLGGGGSGSGTWQYDPAELGPSPNVVFGSMDYAALYEVQSELPESMQSDLETGEDSPISPEDLDQLSGVGGGRVSQSTESFSMFGSTAVTGDLDREAMVDQIESEGDVSSVGEYDNYALYEASNLEETDAVGGVGGQSYDGSATVAIGDSAMVVGGGVSRDGESSVTGQEAVEHAIDASAGDAPLLDDAGGAATDLKGHLGDAMLTVGVAVDPDLVSLAEEMYGGSGGSGGASQYISGLTGGGMTADVDGEEATFTAVLLYEDATRAEDSGVAGFVNFLEGELESEDGISDVSASQDGPAVTVTLTGDTTTLAEQGQSTGSSLGLARQPL